MVRPIDGQPLILQTNAIDKLQQVHQQQSNVQQHYVEMQFKEEKKLASETVQDPSDVEKALINNRENEGKKKFPQHKTNFKKSMDKEMESEENMESEDGKGKFINIKV